MYELKYFINRRITVEEPHKRNGSVQCTNCQEFGHSKRYFKLPTVCVICGELQNVTLCDKNVLDFSIKKFSNCGENHTANFRGCWVYKSMKLRLSY